MDNPSFEDLILADFAPEANKFLVEKGVKVNENVRQPAQRQDESKSLFISEVVDEEQASRARESGLFESKDLSGAVDDLKTKATFREKANEDILNFEDEGLALTRKILESLR